MSERLDVRRMLLKRGWTEDRDLWPVLRKGGAHWAATNNKGDSGLGGPGGKFTVPFDSYVPARVIVAACEAAASGPGDAEEAATDG